MLLLHGTFSSIAIDFSTLVPALLTAGFCVYGQDYGLLGTAAIKTSAASFAVFAGQVLRVTGAAAVDVVGFSQGGLVLRTALRLDGLAPSVHSAVLIAPSFHGTTSGLIDLLPAGACPACIDQKADSPLLQELAVDGDLEPAVRYAVAVLSTDRVVTPWESQIPAGAGDQVSSVVVNEQCPDSRAVHENLPRSAPVVAWVTAALAADGVAAPSDLAC